MAAFVCRVMQASATKLNASAVSQTRLNRKGFFAFAGNSSTAMRNYRGLCRLNSSRTCSPLQLYRCFDIYGHKRQLVHTGRSLSVSGRANLGNLRTENLIQAWFNEVTTYGTLCIHNVPFHVHIEPLNPVDYPDMNKSIVKTYYNAVNNGDEEHVPGHKLSEMIKLCDMRVAVEEERVEVRCDIPPGVELPLVCVISVPIKFDVEIKDRDGRDGSVTISKMESDNVSVHLEHGDCNLNSLKTASVEVVCGEGNITSSKQLLGTIRLHCGKHGSIKGERLQGVSIQCTTEQGEIDIKTIYAEKTKCISESGDLHIRDCHGDVSINSGSGNLTVDSLDGKLHAELGSGSADVFIARQDGVNIHTKEGDITLRFSEDANCSLDLEAASLEQDESMQTVLSSEGKGCLKSESEHVVRAAAPQGKISLKKQDWLSSIKLQFGNPAS